MLNGGAIRNSYGEQFIWWKINSNFSLKTARSGDTDERQLADTFSSDVWNVWARRTGWLLPKYWIKLQGGHCFWDFQYKLLMNIADDVEISFAEKINLLREQISTWFQLSHLQEIMPADFVINYLFILVRNFYLTADQGTTVEVVRAKYCL